MKNLTLDLIYYKLEKQLLLVQSYTEIDNLAKIIKACRLKPHSYFFEKKDKKVILYKWWFDEYGNSLKINNKIPDIIPGDLNLDIKNIICTDLYFGLSINKIAKISKTAYIVIGKDEDTFQDFCHITFLGIDNYLRSYTYLYGVWEQVPPLLLGINTLSNIIKYDDINYFLKLKNNENIHLPCMMPEQWLTSIEMISGLLDVLKNDTLNSIFK